MTALLTDSTPTQELTQTRISVSGAAPPSPHVLRIAGPARLRLKQRILHETPNLGRYEILAAAGEGAMGMVFAAYDRELERQVALKLFAGAQNLDPNSQVRIKREAQALARLSHPNVVQVYDVGEVEDAIYVAMEFVRGPDLRTWLESHRRTWTDILKIFIQAAQGLSAAHRRTLVHRDFKPSNVLIGTDDRVRVVDFGLARSHDDATGEDLPSSTSTLRSDVTHAGDLIGTPAYMSPEQHMRQPATPLSDQYSFCVVLFEALYDIHPYPTATVKQAAFHACSGRFTAPPKSRVPAWLHRAVMRGMSPDPERRWPSMEALVNELTRERSRRRWLYGAAAVVIASTLSSAIVHAAHQPSVADTPDCAGGPLQIADAWNSRRASSIEHAIRASNVPYADDTADRVRGLLQKYVDTWVLAYRSACLAHVRGEQSDRLLHLRIDCLSRAKTALTVATEVLAQVDAPLADRAVHVATTLPSLARCSDTTSLLTGPPPAPGRELSTSEQAALARAQAQFHAGRYKLALAALTGAELSGPEVNLWHGRILEKLGDYRQAAEILLRAYRGADRAAHDMTRAQASLALADLYNHRLHDQRQAAIWVDQAEAVITRIGAGAPIWLRLHRSRGGLLHNQGQLAAAQNEHHRVLELARELDDGQSVVLADAHNNLANSLYAAGDYDLARQHYQAALTAYRQRLGPQHPDLGKPHNNLSNLLHELGHQHEAVHHAQTALSIYRAVLDPRHPRIGMSLNNLGRAQLATGNYEDSEASLTEAESILVQAHGPDHPVVAFPLSNLAQLAWVRGNLDEAATLHRRALAIRTKHLGAEDPLAAYNLTALGVLALAQGDAQTATAPLERASQLRANANTRPGLWATTAFALARANWQVAANDLDKQRTAHQLAQSALEARQQDRGYYPLAQAEDIQSWLDRHRPKTAPAGPQNPRPLQPG